MTTEEAIAGIRERHGDTVADEIEGTMRRLEEADRALQAIVISHYGSMENARRVADRLLAPARLRAHQ